MGHNYSSEDSSGGLYLSNGMRLTEENLEEAMQINELRAGDTVKVPHNGKMVKGKIVRYDDGGTNKARQSGGGYVVDVGEPASVLVPAPQDCQRSHYCRGYFE
jgi:hypothetical protein